LLYRRDRLAEPTMAWLRTLIREVVANV